MPDTALAAADGYAPVFVENALRQGVRATLSVPLLAEEPAAAVGLLVLRRRAPRPFADAEIALAETLAAQAAIAFQNVRLFSELQDSNRTLTDALTERSTMAEILELIAANPADRQVVLDAIVARAAVLCRAWSASIALVADDGTVRHWAGVGPAPEAIGLPSRPSPLSSQFPDHRSVLERRTVHVHDVLAEPEHEAGRGQYYASKWGFRTVLAVPLLGRGRAVGFLWAARDRVLSHRAC